MAPKNRPEAPRKSSRPPATKKRKTTTTERGEGSNPPVAREPSFLQRNFADDLVRNLYETKFSKKQVKAGRVVKVNALNEVGFPYFDHLDYQGWTEYMQMAIDIYPDLVRVFYANGDNYYEDNRGRSVARTDKFRTSVNGRAMEITPALIDAILGFPMDGTIMGDINMNVDRNLDKAALIYPPKKAGKRNEASVNRFSFHDRLLHMIISGTLRPVGMKYSQFDNEQLCFMKFIKDRRRIRLSSFIVHDMTWMVVGKNKHLYYAMLITRILQHFGVDLSNDKAVKGNDKKPLGIEAIHRIPYILVGDEWVRDDARVEQADEEAQGEGANEEAQEAQGDAPPAQEEAQGGPMQRTIDDLYNLMLEQRTELAAHRAEFAEHRAEFAEFREEVTSRLDGFGVRLSSIELGFRSFHTHLPPPP